MYLRKSFGNETLERQSSKILKCIFISAFKPHLFTEIIMKNERGLELVTSPFYMFRIFLSLQSRSQIGLSYLAQDPPTLDFFF